MSRQVSYLTVVDVVVVVWRSEMWVMVAVILVDAVVAAANDGGGGGGVA